MADSTAQRALSNLVRGAYRDGAVSAAERDAINRAISMHGLIASDADKFENALRPRVIAASRRLSEAKQDVEAGRLGAAAKKYEEATEIDPDDALAWVGLAAALTLNGETEASERAYRRALALDPDNWLACYNLGIGAARRGDSESALDYFRRALKSARSGSPERRAVLEALEHEPELHVLRNDPRFATLLKSSSQ